MSIKSAKAYVERMKADEEFRNKVLDCKDAKVRMELVKTEGFDFTVKEINGVTSELSDDELTYFKAAAGSARSVMSNCISCPGPYGADRTW